MSSKTISITEIFDVSPFSSYQIWVCFLCFCVTFLDGFDLTVIGVALPKIADFLHSKPGALGLALSAGQVGPLIGAVGLGMLADRFGRKQMLFISSLTFGLFTILTAYITSVEQLGSFPLPGRDRTGWGRPERPCLRVRIRADPHAGYSYHHDVRRHGRRLGDRPVFPLHICFPTTAGSHYFFWVEVFLS